MELRLDALLGGIERARATRGARRPRGTPSLPARPVRLGGRVRGWTCRLQCTVARRASPDRPATPSRRRRSLGLLADALARVTACGGRASASRRRRRRRPGGRRSRRRRRRRQRGPRIRRRRPGAARRSGALAGDRPAVPGRRRPRPSRRRHPERQPVARRASTPTVARHDLPFDDGHVGARSRRSSTLPGRASRRPASRSPSGSPTGAPGWASAATASCRRDARSTADTVFSIASITKTFVTAVVMQLVDEGKLSPGRPAVASSCPTSPSQAHHHPPAARPHQRRRTTTSRARRYSAPVFARPGPRAGPCREILAPRRGALLRARAPASTTPTPTSCCWARSSRQVTGKRHLARSSGDRLLDPLGLDAHRRSSPTSRHPRDAAHGHLWGGGTSFYDQTGSEPRCCPTCPRRRSRGGGRDGLERRPTSHAGRWRCTAGRGACRRDLLERRCSTSAREDEYGLGTRTRIFDGRRAVGHGGSLRGYEDGMLVLPAGGRRRSCCSRNRGLYNPDRTRPRAAPRRSGSTSTCPRPSTTPSRNTATEAAAARAERAGLRQAVRRRRPTRPAPPGRRPAAATARTPRRPRTGPAGRPTGT